MVADKLAAARVPVLTGAMNNIPGGFAALGQRQENAALLRKAGVQIALIGNAGGGDEEAFNVRNLKQEAGNAVAYGMTWDDALRAVTLAPATRAPDGSVTVPVRLARSVCARTGSRAEARIAAN